MVRKKKINSGGTVTPPPGEDTDSVHSELRELSSIFEVSSRIGSFRV